MTPQDEFLRLHLRLVLDNSNAFVVIGINRVRPTPAGSLWLKDHSRYLALWDQLHAKGVKVGNLLRKHFGFVEDKPTTHYRKKAR